MDSTLLIQNITEDTDAAITFAEQLELKSDSELNARNNLKSWSTLECLQHLNLYSKFYLPEIERVLAKAKTRHNPEFKSGFLGAYFIRQMEVKKKPNAIKTPQRTDPFNRALDRKVIRQFITHQQHFLQLLDRSKNADLNKEKTRISLTFLVRLKLGDTISFLNMHTKRHLMQIKNISSSSN